MDLRSGLSFWQGQGAPPAEFAPLEGDARCEVLILGGGISGALTGLFLARRGVSALLVDKRRPGTGSTAASTGLLMYQVDTSLSELIGQVGRERAVRAYRRGLSAIDELEALAETVDCEGCAFSRQKGLYFATSAQDAPELRNEYECLRAHEFEVSLVEGSALRDLTSIPSPAAILSVGNAQVDPYAFTQAVLRKAVEMGLAIHGGTEVLSVHETAQGVEVTTSTGRITAGSIIYTTGYEARETPGIRAGKLHSTYAVASAPLTQWEGWPRGCIFWETARPYVYGRSTRDGRAVFGGEDTPDALDHADDGLVERKARALAGKWRELFPRMPLELEYVWAGTFADTGDGLAYIGRIPGKARSYAALGYGGNGITFSMIAARLIESLYVGESSPDAEVFAFERSSSR